MRTRGLTLATVVAALALAGPAVAATHNGGPTPDPAPPSVGSAGGLTPDPVPQATGTGGIVSLPSQGATSHGSIPIPSVSVPYYSLPTPPSSPHRGASATPKRGATVTGAERSHAGARSATKHPAHAAEHRRQNSDARALRQLQRRLALVARAAGSISTAAIIAAAPSHRNGVVLLIGAGVLVLLAAAGGVLLRKLWRLHGEWYGGRPA